MRLVHGMVKSTIGDVATVEVSINEGGCGRCHEVGGCGSQNLSRVLCKKDHSIDVINTLHARVGDRICLGMPEDAISRVATRIYVVPMLGVIAGAATGEALTDVGSLGAIVGALVGFALSFVYLAMAKPANVPSPKMVAISDSSVTEQ